MNTDMKKEIHRLRRKLAAAQPAIDFCAGIHIEALTLLNQADHPTLNQICEENQSLRKQLAEAKPAIDFCVGSDLKTELEFGPKAYKEAVELFRAELAKQVCPTCEKSGDNSLCSDSWHQNLAKNKAAREAIEKCLPKLERALLSIEPLGEKRTDLKPTSDIAEVVGYFRALIQPKEKK